MFLVMEVLDIDKELMGDKAAKSIGKLFDASLGQKWIDGIGDYAAREQAKDKETDRVTSVAEVWSNSRTRDAYCQKLWDYTG